MKERFIVSGQKFLISEPQSGWKLARRPGGWIIAESPSGERVRLAVASSRSKLGFQIRGLLYQGELQQESRGGQETSSGESDLVAQFPGKVRKILAREGETVTSGQPLLLIEAMKMEFTIKSPSNGRVKKVLVQEGQQIGPGDRLADVESSKGNGE